jgi:cytochrome c peroxidase
MDEARGNCFRYHGRNNNPLWINNKIHNNSLDFNFSNLGLGKITADDNGKFKSPSIRNLIFTTPLYAPRQI